MRVVAVIPLYNGAAYIERSLSSVLEQTRPVDEIVVVDDGSSDDGAEIARRTAGHLPHFRIISKPNSGQSSARNHGVRHSTADLIAMLDQDDAWYADHIARLIEPFMQKRARPLGWVYSNLDRIDAEGLMMMRNFLPNSHHPKTSVFHCLGEDMYVLPSAALISRHAFDKVGGFDEQFVGYEDDDLFLRLFRAGFDNKFINKSLSAWRIHNGSTSFSLQMTRSRLKYARKLLRDYPDNPHQNIYYARDVIAPRFVANFVSDVHQAVRFSRPDILEVAREGFAVLVPHLPWRRRLRFAFVRLVTTNYTMLRILYLSGLLRLLSRAVRA
jgi:glycosyltransferase involved in cell wall biosynthesis